jgi:hypothetical protein
MASGSRLASASRRNWQTCTSGSSHPASNNASPSDDQRVARRQVDRAVEPLDLLPGQVPGRPGQVGGHAGGDLRVGRVADGPVRVHHRPPVRRLELLESRWPVTTAGFDVGLLAAAAAAAAVTGNEPHNVRTAASTIGAPVRRVGCVVMAGSPGRGSRPNLPVAGLAAKRGGTGGPRTLCGAAMGRTFPRPSVRPSDSRVGGPTHDRVLEHRVRLQVFRRPRGTCTPGPTRSGPRSGGPEFAAKLKVFKDLGFDYVQFHDDDAVPDGLHRRPAGAEGQGGQEAAGRPRAEGRDLRPAALGGRPRRRRPGHQQHRPPTGSGRSSGAAGGRRRPAARERPVRLVAGPRGARTSARARTRSRRSTGCSSSSTRCSTTTSRSWSRRDEAERADGPDVPADDRHFLAWRTRPATRAGRRADRVGPRDPGRPRPVDEFAYALFHRSSGAST